MNREEIRQAVTRLNCALELERRIVGVKLLHDQPEYEAAEARQVGRALNYCVMVQMAMAGKALKATGENLACPGGARALGFLPLDDYLKSGRHLRNLGLYHDTGHRQERHGPHDLPGSPAARVHAPAPGGVSRVEPDVVIIVSSPYNVMRIVQGYSHYQGIQVNYKMVGNQAICSEVTAYPYLNNDINVSLLCIGTRHQAGWKDHELAVGFPFNRFVRITQGVMDTLNIMESDANKKAIARKLSDNGVTDFEVKYDCNYYRAIPATHPG